jgi:predicted small lipoprotein YifL
MSARSLRAQVFLILVVVVACIGLAACGRKGPLDPPPSAAIPPVPNTSSAPAAKPAFIDPTTPTGAPQQAAVQTSQAQPATPAAQNNSFFLDFLLK